MGGAVRRASSVLVATRPSTPSIASDKEADAASIKGAAASPQPSVLSPPAPPALSPPESSRTQQSTAPSPIAESPAREAAASEEESIPVGPSPLAQESAVVAEPEVPSIVPESSPASPQGYTPPPLLDSHAAGLGPGAFTDEPDELPQSQVIVDPSREPSIFQVESTTGHGSSTHIPEPAVESVARLVAEAPVPESAPAPATPEPKTPPPAVGAARSYFDIPVQDEPAVDLDLASQQQPDIPDAFKQSIEANTLGEDSGPNTDATTIRPEEPVDLQDPVEAQEPAESQGAVESQEPVQARGPVEAQEPVHEAIPVAYPTHSELPTPAHEHTVLPPAAPLPYPMPVFDMNSGQEVWGGVSHKAAGESRSVLNGDASTRSRVSSIR
jgi:hypothetical protein